MWRPGGPRARLTEADHGDDPRSTPRPAARGRRPRLAPTGRAGHAHCHETTGPGQTPTVRRTPAEEARPARKAEGPAAVARRGVALAADRLLVLHPAQYQAADPAVPRGRPAGP